MTIVDSHVHLGGDFAGSDAAADAFAALAARCGVARALVSSLSPAPGRLPAQPSRDEVRACNDWTLRQMARRPDLVLGFCYLSPEHGADFCRREMERCIERNAMVGVKLWTATCAESRKTDPIARRCAALRVPILQHAWYKSAGQLPAETTPAHLAALAERNPETTFIMAHLVGCGRRGLAEIAPHPNVLVDTAGGDVVRGFVEEAARVLGPDRVLFGSDWPIRSLPKQIARVTGSGVGSSVRDAVLGGNALRILRGAPHAKALGLASCCGSPGTTSRKRVPHFDPKGKVCRTPCPSGQGVAPDDWRASSAAPHMGKVVSPAPAPLLRPDRRIARIDVSCHAGTYAPNTRVSATAAQLDRDLAREGIARAYVSPMEALFDQEPEAGNARLAKEIAGRPRLRLVPAVNPSHRDWRVAVERAARKRRAQMVRIYPAYHGYDLDPKALAPFVAACAAARLAIAVQLRIEDVRSQMPRAVIGEVPFPKAAAFALAFPKARFVLCGIPRGLDSAHGLDRAANVWVELSNLDGPDALAKSLRHVPLSRWLYATHSPFYVPRGAEALLWEAGLDDDSIAAIERRNALALFRRA